MCKIISDQETFNHTYLYNLQEKMIIFFWYKIYMINVIFDYQKKIV